MAQAHFAWGTLGSSDIEKKVHAVLPWSHCTKNTMFGLLEAFLKFRRWKVHSVVARARLAAKMFKPLQVQSISVNEDIQKAHASVGRSTCPIQNAKEKLLCRTTFGTRDVQKVQAAVARSTFQSQNAKTPLSGTTFWDHLWTFKDIVCGALWHNSYNHNYDYNCATATTAPTSTPTITCATTFLPRTTPKD